MKIQIQILKNVTNCLKSIQFKLMLLINLFLAKNCEARAIGLSMVPGNHIVSISIDEDV